jgi:hypothetical protein
LALAINWVMVESPIGCPDGILAATVVYRAKAK